MAALAPRAASVGLADEGRCELTCALGHGRGRLDPDAASQFVGAFAPRPARPADPEMRLEPDGVDPRFLRVENGRDRLSRRRAGHEE